MQKPESLPFLTRQRLVELPRRLQQRKRPIDIRLQKRLRPQNRPVHMALRRKVHHRPRPVLAQASSPPAPHRRYRHAQTCSADRPPPKPDSPDCPHTSAHPDSPPAAHSFASQSSTKFDPIKPQPPVTRTEVSTRKSSQPFPRPRPIVSLDSAYRIYAEAVGVPTARLLISLRYWSPNCLYSFAITAIDAALSARFPTICAMLSVRSSVFLGRACGTTMVSPG